MYEIYNRGKYAAQQVDIMNSIIKNNVNIRGSFDNDYYYYWTNQVTRNTYRTGTFEHVNETSYVIPNATSARLTPENKLLISYQQFGNFKQTHSGKWYECYAFCPMNGDYPTFGDTTTNVQDFNATCCYDYIESESELVNYQNNSLYDEWIVLDGYALYDSNNNLITGNGTRGFINPISVSSLSTFRKGYDVTTVKGKNMMILPFGGGIYYIYNAITTDILLTKYLSADRATPYQDPKYSKYVYTWKESSNPFKMLGFVQGNEQKYTVKIAVEPSPFYRVLNRARALIIFETIDDLINYLQDYGFEVYTSLEDLIEGDTEEQPDFGFEDQPIDDIENLPDNGSDTINPPDIKTTPVSLTQNYLLDANAYNQFKSWIYTKDWFEAIKQYFENPLQAVIGCKMYPFDFKLHDSNYIVSEPNIKILDSVSPDISCYRMLPQYNYIFNGGSYTYIPYFGDFNDYLSEYSLYIPFVGTCKLDASQVVGKTIRVTYALDVLTGECQAFVYSNDVLIYNQNGMIGLDIPIESNNYGQRVANYARFAAGFIFSGTSNLPMSLLDTALSSRETIQQTKISPSTALYNPPYPYLTISLAQPIYPSNYLQLQGSEASATVKISDCEGYLQATPFGTWNLSCTATELEEIKSLIQSGIYI